MACPCTTAPLNVAAAAVRLPDSVGLALRTIEPVPVAELASGVMAVPVTPVWFPGLATETVDDTDHENDVEPLNPLPSVATTVTEVSSVVTQEQIDSLPISGRQPTSLALLLPATTMDTTTVRRSQASGAGSATNAATSSGEGGSPWRSNESRRMSVTRSASGAGGKPALGFRIAVETQLAVAGGGVEAFARRLAARKQRGAPGIVGANVGKNRDTVDGAADYVAGIEKVDDLLEADLRRARRQLRPFGNDTLRQLALVGFFAQPVPASRGGGEKLLRLRPTACQHTSQTTLVLRSRRGLRHLASDDRPQLPRALVEFVRSRLSAGNGAIVDRYVLTPFAR